MWQALLVASTIYAAEPPRCPTGNEEVLLSGAITPDDVKTRNIVILIGDKVEKYWDSLRNMHIMLGKVSNVDKIYIMDAPVGQEGMVYVFYLNQGCIVSTVVTYKAIMEMVLR